MMIEIFTPVVIGYGFQIHCCGSIAVTHHYRYNYELHSVSWEGSVHTKKCLIYRVRYLVKHNVPITPSQLLEYITNNITDTTEASLQWRHNGPDGVSNNHPHGCLLNRSFRLRWKKTSKLRVSGLCAGSSSVTGEFPAQRASIAENVSLWWRHHDQGLSTSWEYLWHFLSL